MTNTNTNNNNNNNNNQQPILTTHEHFKPNSTTSHYNRRTATTTFNPHSSSSSSITFTQKLIQAIIDFNSKAKQQHNHSVIMPKKTIHTFNIPNRIIKKSILIIISLTLVYKLMISFIIDRPKTLDLDPTIDPITFQLRPEGDPESIKQENDEQRLKESKRLSNYRIKTNHAINPKITQLLENKSKSNLDLQKNMITSLDEEDWNKRSNELIENGPPNRFKCDQDSKKMIFLGIFSKITSFEKRSLIRTCMKLDLPPSLTDNQEEQSLIEFKFILSEPENENWKELIELEKKLYHDLIVLKQVKIDNINLGKTYEFFNWIVSNYQNKKQEDAFITNRKSHKPKFVIKADDDTFLVIPNLIKEFKGLNCQENIYWGTSQGSNPIFPFYFRGLAYGLSWPLVEWIGSSKLNQTMKEGIEDARVGTWLYNLKFMNNNNNNNNNELKIIDLGWRMGDWNQLEIDHNTVGLHWIKINEWFPMIRLKVLKSWKKVNLEYKWNTYL